MTGGTFVYVCVRNVCFAVTGSYLFVYVCVCSHRMPAGLVSASWVFGKYSLVSISPVPRWVHWGWVCVLGCATCCLVGW